MVKCTVCGKEALLHTYSRKHNWDVNGRAYCSEECSKNYRREISSKTMTQTNLKYASARMKVKNPMHNQETRKKVSAAHKRLGHEPKIRGGNGRGPTLAEKTLAEALGFEKYLNCIVKTKMPVGSGYTTHYKLDLGIPNIRLAIEIDGRSHWALKRQAEDRKKEAFLNGLRWTVLRFTNKHVMEHLEECVRTVTSTILRLRATTRT